MKYNIYFEQKKNCSVLYKVKIVKQVSKMYNKGDKCKNNVLRRENDLGGKKLAQE